MDWMKKLHSNVGWGVLEKISKNWILQKKNDIC
jgi:hypothetical protein